MLGTIISFIITGFLLYVAYNTKIEDAKAAWYIYVIIGLLGMACPLSAIVLLGIIAVILYNGVKEGFIDTLDWIENIINRIN